MTNPSVSDYGTYDESTVPRLWDGVIGAWCPSLGPTGTRLHDFSRYNNWGTLTNMDAATDWVVDGGQYALDFDGTNDYIDIGTRQYLTYGVAATVSWWERITSSGNGYYSRFRLKTGAQDMAVLRTDQATYLGISTFNVSIGASKQFASAPSVANSVGVWRHFALVMAAGPDGTTNSDWTLYVDGVSYAATAAGTGVLSNGVNRIGWDSADNGANCMFSDFAIYGRAITANEARELYLLGRGGMFQRRRVRRGYVSEAAVKSYLFLNRGQVIGGGTL